MTIEGDNIDFTNYDKILPLNHKPTHVTSSIIYRTRMVNTAENLPYNKIDDVKVGDCVKDIIGNIYIVQNSIELPEEEPKGNKNYVYKYDDNWYINPRNSSCDYRILEKISVFTTLWTTLLGLFILALSAGVTLIPASNNIKAFVIVPLSIILFIVGLTFIIVSTIESMNNR